MKKKILFSVLFSIVLILSSVVCFAANNENKTTMKGLGNEITSSINETEKSIDNLVDVDTLDHASRTRTSDKDNSLDMGNTVGNTMENAVKNTADNFGNDVKNTTNKTVAGVTGNYAAGEVVTTDGNGMSTTTWIWIILAIVAVIIIASVWYYASQRND